MSQLQLATTDPRTGASLPAAVADIVDVEVHLAADIAIIWVATWVDAKARSAGYASLGDPVRYVLSTTEIAVLRNAFRAQLFALLQARPEYAGAVVT